MKTKLVTSEEDSIIGYNNVMYDKFMDIDNNSCFELYIDNNVLKMVPNNVFKNFMKTCCQKIRMGGVIIIIGKDIMKISLSYIRREINEENLSELLFNSNGFYNCRLVEEEIKNNNIKIQSMSISDNNFIVRGIRE